MYYIEQNEKIVLFDENQEKLENTILFRPELQGSKIKEVQEGYVIVDFELITIEEAKAREAQKEHERIQELSMTRSDFFDGTIKAFGLGQDELQTAIEIVLANLPLDEVTKKVALNNYKNALNFYRKHDLFTLLSGVTIPVSETSITITSEQWDKFFDETNKGNPEAYKELLPEIVEDSIEE